MQTLKDVMSHDVQVIGPEGTIKEAAQQMRQGDFGMMPVEENNFMIGVLSDRDITIRAIAEGKDANTKVRDIMSRDVIIANEQDLIEDAASLMGKHQISNQHRRKRRPGAHRCGVSSCNQLVVGIILADQRVQIHADRDIGVLYLLVD